MQLRGKTLEAETGSASCPFLFVSQQGKGMALRSIRHSTHCGMFHIAIAPLGIFGTRRVC
ncbi:hypothetical protein XbrCFBP1976_11760 [Xanthomonas bromi]|uniref:Uncharacterized protein n=1 Tax=Xanthomonas bromi TaxID=56449 RepID=A0ABX5BNV9_9XANT|nr:hypothetical protein XbrCFBP1976_11760 [Xanthomonas bromi]